MLTEQQLHHYRVFGFVILKRLFSPAEVGTLRAEYEAGLNAAYADAPFDGTRRYWTNMLGPATPLFASLLEDPRFCEVAQQLYGEDVVAIGTDANRYVGHTGWHPDHGADPDQDTYGVKFAFYLDPVAADTGALRLIPGSHIRPYHDELRSHLAAANLEINQVPCHACDADPGDVVSFDMRCWHASWGGAAGRRMCTCVYYNNPRGPLQEGAARKRAQQAQGAPAQFGRPGQPLYDPHWLRNPQGHPQRQRWIERLAELGYFERPGPAPQG